MEETPSKYERWPLVRQAIVFQFKLGLDALRDILMSPVSIVLVVIDIIMANKHQQSYFLRLMRLGKQSDHWINLFDHSLSKEETSNQQETVHPNVDYWFSRIEAGIKEQQIDGKLSQTGREKLQQYFRKVTQTLDNSESKDADKNHTDDIHK